jgi:hypothetical protein
MASFQHGALESRFTWMSPEVSSRTWMPAIYAGMTMMTMISIFGALVRENFLKWLSQAFQAKSLAAP